MTCYATQCLTRISHTFVGRNERTQTLPELRSMCCGYSREQGINGENCVRAVPARLCDLVPACEKCGLMQQRDLDYWGQISQDTFRW